jgi:hypothetical protein
VPGVEGLEPRALLAVATESFQAPDLTDLKEMARRGVNTAPAAIDRMVQALETQLTSGPLADLQAGTVDGSGFVQEVAGLVASYQANADQQLSPGAPNVDNLIKLQGARIQADVNALNQQSTAGLLTSDQLATDAATTIGDLTGGSLKPLGTPLSAYVSRTQTFEADLNTLVQSLASGASTPLTIADVGTALDAEAAAYRADLAGSLYVHPRINTLVDNAVINLENQVTSISQANPGDAQAQVQDAVTAFDSAILDTTGVFGPNGVVARNISESD